jgi:hypothetical protein
LPEVSVDMEKFILPPLKENDKKVAEIERKSTMGAVFE